MTEGKYRTHEICQFDYSDIWEKSFDENYTDKSLRNDEVIKLLNEQDNRIKELETENSQLKRKKERYKLLSEIRDENINNRILSLKNFINNCEDEKVKNTLEDLFYSEVKEYDLAKENRKLKRENEQLKQQINDIRFDWSQDYREFHKDTLYIEDHNTKIKLKDGRLYIDVFIPELGEYFRFDYIVTGRKLEKEYIIKGDCDE